MSIPEPTDPLVSEPFPSEPQSEAYNHLQLIRELLEKGDDVEGFKKLFPQRNMFDKDFMFWPPNLPVLHYCTINNRPKCIKYLVKYLLNLAFIFGFYILGNC
jgi:hypothetical protein